MKKPCIKISIFIAIIFSFCFCVYASTSTFFYADSNDGCVYKSGTVYATVHDADTGSTSNSSTSIEVGQYVNCDPVCLYDIYRGVIFFDTSTLPNNAIISSATLSTYVKWIGPDGDYYLVVQQVDANLPLVMGDYDKNIFGESGDLSFIHKDDLSNDSYNEFALNSSGLDLINKTGFTMFAIRSSDDVNSTNPGASDTEEYIEIASADTSGTNKDPKLIILYSEDEKKARPLVNTSLAKKNKGCVK